METKFSVSEAGIFRRIMLEVSDSNRPTDCELSAIVTSPSGKEEIFLPSPEKIVPNVAYAHSGGRFVTQTGRGRYQIIFQPKEKGRHEIKVVGRASGKPFEKKFHTSL